MQSGLVQHWEADGVAKHQWVHVIESLLHQVVGVLHQFNSCVVFVQATELKCSKNAFPGLVERFRVGNRVRIKVSFQHFTLLRICA